MNRALFDTTSSQFNLTADFGYIYTTSMSNSVYFNVTDGQH